MMTRIAPEKRKEGATIINKGRPVEQPNIPTITTTKQTPERFAAQQERLQRLLRPIPLLTAAVITAAVSPTLTAFVAPADSPGRVMNCEIAATGWFLLRARRPWERGTTNGYYPWGVRG